VDLFTLGGDAIRDWFCELFILKCEINLLQ